jgi:hypothetical protein
MAKKSKMMNAAQQKVALKKRHGSSVNWVDVTLPLTYDEVLAHFGPQCEDYEPMCGCCRAWVQWHTSEQRVTVSVERDAILKAMGDGT